MSQKLVKTRPRGNKKIMLNAAEHKILNACQNNNKKHQEIQHFLGSDKPRVFFPAPNVKMPTIVSILTFMNRENFMPS